jgi:SRSO17 transposase
VNDERRNTGYLRAEAAGYWAGRQQAVLGGGRWDANALRDLVRDYLVEHLADDDAVLLIDEIGFLKQGRASCGVSRQYIGFAGKITNCQIGVLAVRMIERRSRDIPLHARLGLVPQELNTHTLRACNP